MIRWFVSFKSSNERGNISGAPDATLSRYVIKYLYLFDLVWLREQDLLKCILWVRKRTFYCKIANTAIQILYHFPHLRAIRSISLASESNRSRVRGLIGFWG